MTTTKSCPKCGVVKPASEFYANKSKADGLATHCKPCGQEWREANRAHLSEYNRKASASRQKETKPTATKMDARWSESDDEELMRTDISMVQISKNLGRSYGAASQRRAALKARNKRLAMIANMRHVQ